MRPSVAPLLQVSFPSSLSQTKRRKNQSGYGSAGSVGARRTWGISEVIRRSPRILSSVGNHLSRASAQSREVSHSDQHLTTSKGILYRTSFTSVHPLHTHNNHIRDKSNNSSGHEKNRHNAISSYPSSNDTYTARDRSSGFVNSVLYGSDTKMGSNWSNDTLRRAQAVVAARRAIEGLSDPKVAEQERAERRESEKRTAG
jgi:hypothetical protein